MALQSEVSSVLVSFGMGSMAPGGCWGTKVSFFCGGGIAQGGWVLPGGEATSCVVVLSFQP